MEPAVQARVYPCSHCGLEITKSSKRNLFVAASRRRARGCVIPGIGVGSRRRTVLSRRAGAVSLATIEKLDILNHDFVLGAFLSGGLVVPLVELESAFEVHLPTLRQILLDEIGLLAEFATIER